MASCTSFTVSAAAALALASLASLAACSSSSSPGADGGAKDASADTPKAHDAADGGTKPHDATAPVDGKPAPDGKASTDAGAAGLTCGKLTSCDQACTTTACTNACYAEATGVAQGLFDALNNCINEVCGSGAGQVCADAGSSACSSCQSGAATSSTCSAILFKCLGDKTVGPPDPDGGAVVDAGGPADAGPELNCGGLEMCEGACGDAGASCTSTCVGKSTAEAQSLANALDACLTAACPTGDGGSCATAGSNCTGCRTQAEFDPSVCGTPFSTCQNDLSNAPDAGTSPVGLRGGTVVTLASGLDQPQVVIVQNDDVYFSQVSATGPVQHAALSDGGTTGIDNASQPYPMGLALDSTNIYVWNSGSFSGSTTVNQDDGSLVQVPLAGGSAVTLATGIEAAYAAPYLNAVAVGGGSVYWVAGASGDDGAIMTTPVGTPGGSAVYAHQLFPEAVATDGTNLYWANWGSFDASGNYNNDGTVLQGSIHGGAITTLATAQSAPAALVVDSQNVYWTNAGRLGGDNLPAPGTGSVMQAPIGGGTLVTLGATQAIPLGITVGNGTVYWNAYTLSAPGQILSTPIGGGAIVALVGGLANPFGLTVSGQTLVWSDSPPTQAGSGKILALTLP